MDLLPRLGLTKTLSRGRSPSRSSGSKDDDTNYTRNPLPSPSSASGGRLSLKKLHSRNESGQQSTATEQDENVDELSTRGREIGNGDNLAVEYSFPSLLSPPNPAFVAGSEMRGILVNARRPTSKDRNGVAISPGARDHDDLATQRNSALHVALLTQSRPQLRTSLSTDSGERIRTGSDATITASSTTGDSNNSSKGGNMRIRFAPLPDPRRPRRYSTGRDIWVEDDEHLHLKSSGVQADPGSWNEPLPGEAALSNPSSGINIPGAVNEGHSNGSISPNISSFGSNYSASRGNVHKRTESTTSSITSKIFSFGRKKDSKEMNRTSSMESTASANNLSSWLSGEPLGRRISTGTLLGGGSELEQQRAAEFRSSGVPLRKASTFEREQSGSTGPPRKAYPSVAQGGTRRRSAQVPKPKKVEEPEFLEWTNPTAGNSLAGANKEEEDDGSGMAWLKKRRQERERKEKEDKEKVEKEAVEGATSVAETDGVPSGLVASEASEHPPATSQIMSPSAKSGFENPQEANVPPLQAQPSPNINKVLHSDEVESGDEESDSEEEEEEGEQDSSSDEGDDLTAAEIEEEERLAEEARRTTEGAAKEVYHSHEHHASTRQVEAGTALDAARRGSPAMSSSKIQEYPFHQQNTSRSASGLSTPVVTYTS